MAQQGASMEKAIEAAVEAGLSREEAEQIAGAAAAKQTVATAAPEENGGGTDRVRGWFDQVGWELDEGALRSALTMLDADQERVDALVVEAAERRAAGHQPEPFKGHRWIEIPRWEEFQHPDVGRSKVPPWIKNYTRQLSDDDYLCLTFHQRGVLEGIRLEYARALRQLSDSTVALTRRLGQRVTARDLAALQNAGFLHFSASKPASTPASNVAGADRDGDRETPTPSGNASSPTRNHTPKPAAESFTCPVTSCGITKRTRALLNDHLANVHDLQPETATGVAA